MGRILPAYVDGFLVCSRRALRAGVTRESEITSNDCDSWVARDLRFPRHSTAGRRPAREQPLSPTPGSKFLFFLPSSPPPVEVLQAAVADNQPLNPEARTPRARCRR